MSRVINPDGSTLTLVTSSALPTGAATGAKQDTGNASLASVDGKIVAVNTGAVVVASSALPSGAATSANQSAEQTLVGAVNETAPGSDTASSGLNGRLQRIAQNITTLLGRLPAALVSGRLDVNIGASPATVPVSAASLPLPTGAATETTLSAVSGKLPATLGQKAMSAALAVSVASDQSSIPTTEQASTTGGTSAYSFLSTAAVQAAAIKATAGQLYGVQFFNSNASPRFVRLYNQSASPGTGDAANIVYRGMIPGNTGASGHVVSFSPGIACASGIGIRVTAAVADSDATALAASEIMGNVQYK